MVGKLRQQEFIYPPFIVGTWSGQDIGCLFFFFDIGLLTEATKIGEVDTSGAYTDQDHLVAWTR